MRKAIIKNDQEDFSGEIDTILPSVMQETEQYNLDEEDLKSIPEGSIKYELNLIEFPIFSKDKHIAENVAKTYIFSDHQYVKINPPNDSDAISRKILQEFDEQIFYGILKIYDIKKDRRIVTDYATIMAMAGINKNDGSAILRTKDSLQRMRKCEIIFNGVFYDAFAKTKGGAYINRNKSINLLSSLETITIKDYESMNESEKQFYDKSFKRHGNIKEIVDFTIHEDIVNNMENKGHKYFLLEDLLAINNATARKIYIMITKWRYWDKGNEMTRNVKFLASRIPLSWKKQNIPGTVRTMENACKILKDIGKIGDYKINKEEGLENSKLIFTFNDEKDKLYIANSKVGVGETGQENLTIQKIEDSQQEYNNPINDKIRLAIEKAKKSLNISKHANALDIIISEFVNTQEEDLILEVLERLYNYKKEIQNFFTFISGLVENVKKEPKELWVTNQKKSKPVMTLFEMDELNRKNNIEMIFRNRESEEYKKAEKEALKRVPENSKREEIEKIIKIIIDMNMP